MKSIALALLALLFFTAANAKTDCQRVRTAADKLLYIVQNSWDGPNAGNPKILRGVALQANSDINSGVKWSEKLVTIKVDPQTGDPVDCSAIAAKHNAFLKAFGDFLPKFETAGGLCSDAGNALNGKCGGAVKDAFEARDQFIKGALFPFVEAEKSAPPICQSGYNGYYSGASLLPNGQVPEPCARPYFPGGRAVCADIPLKYMADGAKDACNDELNKINPSSMLHGATLTCGTIGKIRDNLELLRRDFNRPNKLFFEASIAAVIARDTLLSMKKELCDGGAAAGACDPGTQPAPHWGTKGGQCLKSCGALGGTSNFTDSCSNHGKAAAGDAYDVVFCCK